MGMDSFILRYRTAANPRPTEQQGLPPPRQTRSPVHCTFTDTAHHAHYAKWNKFDPTAQQDDPTHTQRSNAAQFVAERIAELKLNGNQLFKKKKFQEAADLYTMALRLGLTRSSEIPKDEWNPLMTQCYGNRAMCNLKLNKPHDTVKDCQEAIQIDPNYVKAWARRATAYRALGKLDAALSDFRTALANLEDRSEERTSVLKEIQAIEKQIGSLKQPGQTMRSANSVQMVKTEGLSENAVEGKKVLNSEAINCVQDKTAEAKEPLSPPKAEKGNTPMRKSLPKRKISTAYDFENVFREVSNDAELVIELLMVNKHDEVSLL